MNILTIFKGFREKRTRIDLQGPIMLESHQDVELRQNEILEIFQGGTPLVFFSKKFFSSP